MTKEPSGAYAQAGVDVTAGYKAVELMGKHVARTLTPGAIGAIGGFGGLFQLDLAGISEPVLVSGTDGVGTKLKLAFLTNTHNTVGIDCVAMCANDVVCSGARPLFFLDYLALGKNVPEKVAEIVQGVSQGCVEAGCALIGGETAEMPGFYPVDEYDMAGFCVGVVDRSKILDKENVAAGDVIIGLPSSGVHSNGFSLVRQIFAVETADLSAPVEALGGQTLGEVLLEPTRIYVKPLLALFDKVDVKSASHITGGGFFENIPRALPSNLGATIDVAALPKLPIFDLIQTTGDVSTTDMFGTFNMGVGMMVVVSPDDVETALATLREAGEDGARVIGTVTNQEGVELS